LWLALGVIPAWGYARFAVAGQLDVLVRHENIHAVRSLQERNAAIEDEYRGIDPGGDFLARRSALGQLDIYWSEMYWPTDLGSRVEAVAQDASEGSGCPSGAFTARRSQPGQPSLLADWRPQPPIYNPTARQMRHLSRAGSGLGEWFYPPAAADVGNATIADIEFCSEAAGLNTPLLVRSMLPIAGAQPGRATLAGAVAVALLLVAWVRFGMRQLVFGDISVMPDEPYFAGLFAGNVQELIPVSAPAVGRGLGRRATSRWFAQELAAIPEAWRPSDDEQRSLYQGVTRREALERLVAREADYYRTLWAPCSRDQKLVLAQFAREGLANPKQRLAVQHLLERGLLLRNPVLQVMNQSFALFALREFKPESLVGLEHSQTARFGWRHLKWILLVGMATIIAFLWMTQPTAVDNIVGYLTAAAVGVGALLRLVSASGQLAGKGGQG
jgi:hypothetical protein